MQLLSWQNLLTDEEYDQQLGEFCNTLDEQNNAWRKFELEGGNEADEGDKKEGNEKICGSSGGAAASP